MREDFADSVQRCGNYIEGNGSKELEEIEILGGGNATEQAAKGSGKGD